MRRKSTLLADTDSLEIKNTGLRPSWDAFWAADSIAKSSVKNGNFRKCTTSTISVGTNKSNLSIRHVQFVTGSEWIGEFDNLGMSGVGTYRMPHGVIYEGGMNDGVFEGIGTLNYPNGGALEGFWQGGNLKYCQYNYSDRLKRDSSTSWPYCTMPDRRFYSELLYGLEAADTEQLTNDVPTREIPPCQYDVGDGFYDPRTKCVTDPVTGDILRIPTAAEENWILANCRAAEVRTVGYRPKLYENWFKTDSDISIENECSEFEKEMLELIMQRGCRLDSPEGEEYSQIKRMSLLSKFDFSNYEDLQSVSSIWSRTTGDFEEFLKKIIKDMAEGRQRYSLRLASDDLEHYHESFTEDDDHIDDNLLNLLYGIAKSFSEHMLSSKGDSEPIVIESWKGVPASSEGSHIKFIEPILQAVKSVSTQPFYQADYYSDTTDSTGRSHLQSQDTGSTVQLKIDYADYESVDRSVKMH